MSCYLLSIRFGNFFWHWLCRFWHCVIVFFQHHRQILFQASYFWQGCQASVFYRFGTMFSVSALCFPISALCFLPFRHYYIYLCDFNNFIEKEGSVKEGFTLSPHTSRRLSSSQKSKMVWWPETRATFKSTEVQISVKSRWNCQKNWNFNILKYNSISTAISCGNMLH